MDVKKQIIFQIYKNYRAPFDFLDRLKGKEKNKQASELMLHLSSFQESNG